MALSRLPLALRLVAYGVALAVLLYLTQAPTPDLPRVDLWDKAEHASAWLVLTAIGVALFPRRAALMAVAALAFGGLVEVLQWLLPFGRDADWRDWAADATGVATAVLAWAAARRIRA